MTAPRTTGADPQVPVVDVLGLPIAAVGLERAATTVMEWATAERRAFVTFATVHGVMEAQRRPEILAAYRRCDLCAPDGMPLVWVARLRGGRGIGRVYGPDLMLEVCRRSVDLGLTHYFYGGREGVPQKLRRRLERRFPGLKVVGVRSPPFRPLTAEEETRLVAEVETLAPDFFWVGLGAPKQELWMAAHAGRLATGVMLGVGAAFDFHAGLLRQAPRWMQRAGLEWLFRLAVEPRRLWRRYLYNNPLFVAAVIAQLLGLRRGPRLPERD